MSEKHKTQLSPADVHAPRCANGKQKQWYHAPSSTLQAEPFTDGRATSRYTYELNGEVTKRILEELDDSYIKHSVGEAFAVKTPKFPLFPGAVCLHGHDFSKCSSCEYDDNTGQFFMRDRN